MRLPRFINFPENPNRIGTVPPIPPAEKSALAAGLHGSCQKHGRIHSPVRDFLTGLQKKGESGVELWWDGSPLREFLYADDLADAVIFLMENTNWQEIGDFVNVGTGKDISIKNLASLMAEIIQYTGSFFWDTSKPNGTPRKLLDVSRFTALGWRAKTSLKEGIEKTYQWYCENV